MTKHLALVVDYELPDDADTATLEAALRTMATKIHELAPEPPANITAYAEVSAELIAEAARTGAIVDQATRLRLAPDDVVTVRLHELDAWTEKDLAKQADAAKLAFPNHKVVFLARDTTIETRPAS